MRLVRAFLRVVPNERQRLLWLTIVIGVVCGFVAVAFHSAIRYASSLLIERSLAIQGNAWQWWVIATPTVGAALAGILLHYVVPNARGSGIPQVKLVYSVKSGRLRFRDAVGKFLVSALQLGTGSALGREGPTVLICSSVASALGRVFAIAPRNLRRLIPVGAAAGIAAAFNAPIAAVTFTIEELVGDLDQTVLSGVVIAAALAAAVEHSILGEHPVFNVPGSYRLEDASSLLTYGSLGVAAALLSYVFHVLLLSLRARFRTLRGIHPALVPALGGLGTGILAVVVSVAFGGARGVLGDGYTTLSAALVGRVSLEVMGALIAAKLLATMLCYSTGGAGGIFAPVLFIGGMLGGVFGHLDRAVFGHLHTDLGAFALVGMGAFFAAVIRAPMTSILIIFEMTRGYGLILPLMIANTVAYALARSWRPVPIYEALLEQDGFHLPQTQRAAAVLSSLRVSEAMTTEVVALPTSASVAQSLGLVSELAFTTYPIVDAQGEITGLVSHARLRRLVAEGHGAAPVGLQARAEPYLRADMALVEAVAQMGSLSARQMAVVDSSTNHLVGMLAMSDIMRAHAWAAEGTSAEASQGVGATSRGAVNWRHRDSTSRHAAVVDSENPPDET
jgi:CIC family chloride channel protein